jgi:hypothetical protein
VHEPEPDEEPLRGAANSFANPIGTGIARDNAASVVQVDLNLQF